MTDLCLGLISPDRDAANELKRELAAHLSGWSVVSLEPGASEIIASAERSSGGTTPDALLLLSPGTEELLMLSDQSLAELPMVVLRTDAADAGAATADVLENRRGVAMLRSPWEPVEIAAALTLALRGGVYRDDEGREPATAHLTPREREVLDRLAEGWTNRGIAMELGISENTVKFHLAAIYRKLGAESRTEALVRGAQEGFLAF